MANQSLYGFPRRTYQEKFHRSYNGDYAPRYADISAWYCAENSFADDTFAIRSVPGDKVGCVYDMSQYGRHMKQTGAPRPDLIVDNGFYALSFAKSLNQYMLTAAAVNNVYLMFMVMRAPTTSWDYYTCALGKEKDTGRPWLTLINGTGLNDTGLTIQRKNGVAQALFTTLGPINAPFLLVLDWRNPAYSDRLCLGQTNAGTFIGSNIVYEVITYTSVLTTADIQDVESMLMAKYNIT